MEGKAGLPAQGQGHGGASAEVDTGAESHRPGPDEKEGLWGVPGRGPSGRMDSGLEPAQLPLLPPGPLTDGPGLS